MKNANVTSQLNGVKINFTGSIEKKNVVEMVQRCQSGKCDCMSDESKSKIKDIQVSGMDSNVELSINGDINVKEIKEALERSSLIN